jgi:hypothetical protein
MTDASSSAHTIVRAAFLKIDPEVTLRAVDSLDLRAHAKVSAVVGVPLRQLQQRRDVAAFASSAPIVALKGLLELLALRPLEKTIELLGEHADSPSFEQLSAAVDELLVLDFTIDDVVAVLAFAIGESFNAAPHCRRLLEEREEFSLPELPDVLVPAVLAAPREVSAEIREQRKARREEEKRRKKTASSQRPPRPTKAKGGPTRPDAIATPAPPEAAPVLEQRRRLLLTPLEASHFDTEHALVGSVLVAPVPFDATDPEQPDVKSKDRPVLVVAASHDGILVRPIYSSTSAARTIFQPWRRVGLDHASYIADERVIIASDSIDSLAQLGQLTTSEWNALI